MSKKKSTIHDVAELSGVSLATVSRVLNNPEKVKESTKEKVFKIIEELNFQPNFHARNLASAKTETICILASKLTRASIAEAIDGILEVSNKYKYHIKVFNIDLETNISELFKTIIASRVCGLIYLTDFLENDHIKHLKNLNENFKIPVILANTTTLNNELTSISIDYYKASKELTNLLIEEGRKNICFMSTVQEYSVSYLKEQGYIDTMIEHNLEPKIFRSTGIVRENTPIFTDILKNNKIDGAICTRDSIAVSFMNVAIKEYNINVPEKLSVCSFQNTKYSELSRPTLTCIKNPVYEIGVKAIDMLTTLINSTENSNIETIYMNYEIIKRDSTR